MWLLAGGGLVGAQPLALPISASAGDQAGYEVALAGDYLLVGAPFDDEGGTDAGAAYVFRRAGAGWTLDAKLTAADAVPGARFGASVAFEGAVAVVGAPEQDGAIPETGAAYVFERTERGAWRQAARLWQPRARERIGAKFGTSVAAAGGRVLVVSGEAAYLYERDAAAAGGWVLRTMLPTLAGSTLSKGWLGERTALASAWQQPHLYLFTRAAEDAGWQRAATVTVSAGTGPDVLAEFVWRAQEDEVLAGLPLEDARSPRAGVVASFRPEAGRWQETTRIIAPDGARDDKFGVALAAAGRRLVVGATGADGIRENTGAVYVYARDATDAAGWAFEARITPPPGAASFGAALALQGDLLVVGAPHTEARAGAVYVYDLSQPVASEALTIERIAGLSVPPVTALVQDHAGFLWLGTLDGLHRYDGYGVRTYRHDPADTTSLPDDDVVALLEDRRGALWIGTEGGFGRRDPGCDCFRRYPLYRPAGAAGQDVVALFEDRDGTLWTGTHGRLFRYDVGADRFEVFTPFTGPPDALDETYVSAIQQDSTGALWVLAKNLFRISHSLYRVEPATGAVRRFAVPEAWGQIGPLLIDSRGRFWVNAAEPLRFSEDGARLLPPAGPVADVPWTIYEDRTGTIWHGTPSGAYHRAPEAAEATLLRFVEDVNASTANFVMRVYEDDGGRLLMGTMGGALYHVQHARPGEALRAEVPLKLTEVALTNAAGTQTIDPLPLDVLRLSHRDYRVALTYAALNFAPPGVNRYRYRLDGYDRDWVEAGTRREARYTNLPPGRYVFRAEATDVDGRTVAAPLAVPLVVAPPWWGTAWFRLLALAALAALLAVAYRYRVRRLLERERLTQTEEEARRLAALDAAKSRFFANVSHEFRTPLTLILGAADRLGEADAEAVRRPARRLLGLVDQLLDLSKLEAGRLTLDPRPGDLAAALRRLVGHFAPLAERRGIALTVRTDGEACPAVFDADKVSTIVSNLLANALKYTPEGGKVLVALSQHPEGERLAAEVVVKDTGPGIPKDALPRIFDRFEQVGGTEARDGQQGTGIGLALAKELAELHGGTILVESEVGFGSAFIVRLPLERADGVPETPAEDGAPDPPALVLPDGAPDGAPAALPRPAGRPTVLLVEDNAEVRALVRGYLAADYHVVEAADGEEGLARAREDRPDLVLSDVMMPRLDGVALCRALKADEGLRTVPVVLLTAKASDDAAVEGLGAGADAYLTKPFHAGVLRATLHNLLAARGQMRAQFSRELVVQPSGVVVASEEEAFLERVLAAVEDRLGDSTFGVEALAEAVSLSRRQLERRLKDATGQTPAELIRQMRLERASQLLQARSGSVSEIAYAVGYKSANYFSTAFKEAFGHAPSEHFDHAS